MKTETTSHTSQLAPGAWEEQKLNGPLKRRFFSKPNLFGVAAFALLWFVLINELRVEWTVNPQYSYGWVVPLLALGLLLRRWPDRPGFLTPDASRLMAVNPQPSTLNSQLLYPLLGCAAAILPLRLLLEATPGWRTLNLLLAVCIIGLSLMGVYLAAGWRWTWHLAFPICFILVAVPWPYSVEVPLVQGLTQANANLVVEIMGVLGIPAVQHGNTIEVSTGTVGIDEACSGIRSFQSSLMISLFLGEFFRLGLSRRLLLVPLGFLVAFGFNVCRTGLLTWLAATKGVVAIAQYHDQAGLTILLACTATLWLIAWLFYLKKPKAQSRKPKAQLPAEPSEPSECVVAVAQAATGHSRSTLHAPRSTLFQPFAVSLVVWLIAVEAGVELWYRAHESRSSKNPQWTLNWPPREAGFREVAVPEVARKMLRYDEGHAGAWQTGNSVEWCLYYFRWLPGRLSLSSARGHNPNVCLAAAGKQLRKLDDGHSPIQIGPLVFPFRRYEFMEDGRVVHVFHCLWEEGAAGTYFEFDPTRSLLQQQLRATFEGRRNLGQRSLEFIIRGIEEPKAAQTAVAAQLHKLVQTASPR